MIFKDTDPLKEERLDIIDKEGQVINDELLPKINKDTLLHMYKTMVLGRIADEKAVQFQRQGRMLTYAPNIGQEAAQAGPMAAMEDQDWLVLAFRELSAMLYKGIPLEQIYLYWYGNEMGSKYADELNVLPINVPIGSQISHAAGVAYANKLKKNDQATIAFIGEGGTSHGEFHEGINFAATFNVPLIIVIQNNQYAISTPVGQATKSKTLAQKAIAYGIKGIQVDGNDPLAMYLATQEARKRVMNDEGPVLIEAVTYRMGPHTTSDNPSLYRSDEEVEKWKERDPIKRFRQYLIDKKFWSKKKDETLYDDTKKDVRDTFKKVEKSGEVPLDDIFSHMYGTMPDHLKKQREAYKRYLNEEGQ